MNRLFLKPKEMTINEKIKFLRISNNFTQNYVAEELGIDAANYSRLERGLVKITTEKLEKIAKLYQLNTSEIIDSNPVLNSQIIQNNAEIILTQILSELKEINKKL